MSEPLEIAENWVYEVWQRGNLDFAEQMCAENYFDAAVPQHPDGDCAAFKEIVANTRAAFPDLKAEVLDSFQDQDFVILRIFFTGTHESDYEEFAPTQKKIEWESIDILHFRDDRVIERFAQNDLLETLEDTGTDFGDMQRSSTEADLIGRLADMPRQVREAVRVNGVHPAREGEWSTQATIGHLWQAERQVWQANLQKLLNEDTPFLEWGEPEQFMLEAEFSAGDLNVLLDALEFLRGETCRYLRELPEEDWQRTGHHSEDGEMDVAGLMEKAFAHDQEHLGHLTGALV